MSKTYFKNNFIGRITTSIFLMTLSFGLLAQSTITGTVSDVDGAPLPGANVIIKGTTIGTITDYDGNYTININSSEDVLMFSMVGMVTEEIEVGSQTTISISLIQDLVGLEEVVVVGYGTMKKADLTGSVGSVDTETLVERGTPNVLQSMQGSIAGVSITQGGGRSQSAGWDIQIRGKSSINGDVSPLYVVDGVIVSDIDFLNPQDIERVDVLKDASSTAIYGSRATAGVVMVTTKSGKSLQGIGATKPTVTYDGFYGITQVARMPDFMDSQEFYNYRFSNFLGRSIDVESSQPIYRMMQAGFEQGMLHDGADTYVMRKMLETGESYDWPGLMTQNGNEQNHFLTVSGSSENVNYYLGTGFNNNKGTYIGDEQDRFNIKGSLDSKINEYFSAGLNVNLAYTNNDNASDDAIEDAFRMNPFMRPYDEEGEYNVRPGNFQAMGTASHQFSDQVNPLLWNEDETKQDKIYRFLGNIYLEAKPIDNLSLKTTLSPSYRQVRLGQYQGGAAGNISPTAMYTGTQDFDWIWDNIINYNLTRGDHTFGAMGLFSMNSFSMEEYYMDVINPTSGTLWYNMASGEMQTYTSEYSESTMESFAVRLNYSYRGKYMVTATTRADGSSRFADGYRWGTFPSAALAWRISEENFISAEWLSNLKLRLSYGITGNNSGVGNYAAQSAVAGPNYYAFGSEVAYGYYNERIVNSLISWESSAETNFGFDFGLFRGRISGSVDMYNKVSSNLLAEKSLPLVSGGETVMDNVGEVTNQGIEISLNTVNIQTSNLTWKTSFAFALNDNEITKLYGGDFLLDADDPITASLFLNQPVNNIYAYSWDGIVSDKAMTVPNNDAAISNGLTPGDEITAADYYYTVYGWTEGMPIIEDLNEDGTIDADNDKKILGSQDAQWTGNISSSLTFKNWDFSFSIYTKQNYLVYSNFLEEYYNYGYRGWNKLAMDNYIPAGTLIDCDHVTAEGLYINPVFQEQTHYGTMPFINATTPNYGAGNIWYEKEVHNLGAIVDASYWKIQNITLGYTFDKSLMEKVGIHSLRVYTNITNPFVFTKYKGFDPEWAGSDSSYDGPSTISYQFGINLKF